MYHLLLPHAVLRPEAGLHVVCIYVGGLRTMSEEGCQSMEHKHGIEVCPPIVSVVGQVGSAISTEPITADALPRATVPGVA